MIPIRQNRLKFLLGLASGFIICSAESQSFANMSKLDSVSQPGFYSIHLGASLRAFLKTDCSDFCIRDANGKAVPYFLRTAFPVYHKPDFMAWPMSGPDSVRSIYVVENKQAQNISDLYFKIRNASVSRSIDLSGSEDGHHWYPVLENLVPEKKYVLDDDCYLEKISFPLSAYPFYRISVCNGKNDPLNILSIGQYASGLSEPSMMPYEANPGLGFSQLDSSNRNSYMTVRNPGGFHISHIQVKFRVPRYFSRRLDILAGHRLVGEYTIAADSIFNFYTPAFKDTVWSIVVYNGDNPALRMVSIGSGQEVKRAVAYLEPGMNYRLEFNDPQARPAQYDLQQFKDSVPSDVPEVKFGEIEKLALDASVAKQHHVKQNGAWPGLVFVLIVLLIFILGLSKPVSDKE